MQRFILVLSLLLASQIAHGKPAHVLPPPEGWEKEITPGFDPSIKSYIFEPGHDWTKPALVERMAAWGPERATPVLIRLYQDGRWTRYRASVAQLLSAANTEEAGAFYLDRMQRLMQGDAPPQDISQEWSTLINQCPPSVQDRFDTLALEYLNAASTMPNLSEHQDYVMKTLCLYFGPSKKPEARAALERYAENGTAPLRWIAIQSMRAYNRRRAYEMAKAFANNTLNESLKEEARRYIEWEGGSLRAQEPMADVINPGDVSGKHNSKQNHLSDAPASPPEKTEGKKSVGFYLKIIKDSQKPSLERQQALAALGQIGSARSIAAWKKLRDTAYAKPGAPQKKETYTHAERMAEAAMMVLCVIPDAPEESNYGVTLQPNQESAKVDEDYATATMCFSGRARTLTDASGSMNVTFRRFGDEWLVSDIPPLVIETL
jgi:hypothetical protein